jgi:hypothetical protein
MWSIHEKTRGRHSRASVHLKDFRKPRIDNFFADFNKQISAAFPVNIATGGSWTFFSDCTSGFQIKSAEIRKFLRRNSLKTTIKRSQELRSKKLKPINGPTESVD